MKTFATLNRLKQKSYTLISSPIPVSLEHPPVKKQMQVLTEMTFIYVLKLLGVEDEKTLAELVARLREGTPFYNFTFLAHNLAKSKTDFDFLTDPENLAAYAKIAEVSRECNVELLPYVNVLARIAENKQYGLYSENQEVGFFLDEYYKCKNSVDETEFLHQFKKILKYETQNVFERFINDRIFSIIQHTLVDYSSKISAEQTLALYVYGVRYYDAEISNDDENFLIDHIGFCVNYLSKHGEIAFKPQAKAPFFPKFANEESSIRYFFEHNGAVRNSLDRFIALLKDVCPTSETYDFCEFLRENLYAKNPLLFDDRKSEFAYRISTEIRNRAKLGNVQLYKDFCRLLPEKMVCERSPNLLHHGGRKYYHFFDKRERFLFYADETGNKNQKVPTAHVFVELEVLKRDENGRVVLWNWNELPDLNSKPKKTDKTEPDFILPKNFPVF